MGSDSKPSIDWEAVHREYRAGQLSVREIARQFDIAESGIRRKAKAEGWDRDLTEQVNKKVRNKLVRSAQSAQDAQQKPGFTENDIIDAAADRAVQMIQLHRQDIATQRQLINKLQIKILKKLTLEEEGKAGDQPELSMVETAVILKHIATAMSKVIPLERQAFNIQEDDKPPDERILIKL